MRVLVLGAGFGGLELSTRLSEELGDDVDVVLIDQAEGFVFGFSKLDVMFGRADRRRGAAPLRRHRQAGRAVRADRPSARSTRRPSAWRPTPAPFEGDVLVVALGADLDPAATPGLVEAGHEFYTVAGAFAARDVLAGFDGGRVIVGVTSTPFKCPPAPSETALLMHDFLTERGLRDRSEIALVMPLPRADPAVARRRRRRCSRRSPSAASSGIPSHLVRELDPARQGRPLRRRQRDAVRPVPRRAGAPRARGGRRVGHVRRRLDPGRPAHARDVVRRACTRSATSPASARPKAGVFAEGQAAVVADAIIATRPRRRRAAGYDGRGVCYLEFGAQGRHRRRHLRRRPGPVRLPRRPVRRAHRREGRFGTTAVKRWFGRDW